jgi:CDP-diacylglycerol---glycerol-3-phosphate 3-phosphatidyltransferase
MTISNESRTRIKRTFEPIALGMGRLGLTPDALTLIGFAITVVGAVLIAAQLWLIGGLVVLFGGVFDMFDGTLARATGRVTTLGAFMDSVFDRAGEVAVYLGLVAGLEAAGVANGTILAAAALGAAVLVSYTRSKAEGLGFTAGTGMAAVGIMPREVRVVVLSAGLVLAGLLGPSTGFLALNMALAVIAVGATITVIQRILHVRSQSRIPPTQFDQSPGRDA